MKFFIKSYFKKFKKTRLFFQLSFKSKLVKINKIRCQNKEYWGTLGCGGKHIKYYPPYEIFKIYLRQPKYASDLFFKWFYNTFIYDEAWKIPKFKGGMYNGSLYREVNKLFKEKGLTINNNTLLKNKDLVDQAIQVRINHYFNTFKSIKKNGFNSNLQPILSIKKNGRYYLLNGHHRIAILSILGYKKVSIIKISLFKRILKILSKKKYLIRKKRKNLTL